MLYYSFIYDYSNDSLMLSSWFIFRGYATNYTRRILILLDLSNAILYSHAITLSPTFIQNYVLQRRLPNICYSTPVCLHYEVKAILGDASVNFFFKTSAFCVAHIIIHCVLYYCSHRWRSCFAFADLRCGSGNRGILIRKIVKSAQEVSPR
jgi:hypothetical protein